MCAGNDRETGLNELEQRLLASATLPTLPSIAQRLLGMLHDDVGISELTEVISVDPAITAKLLRLVNSPMYGVSREISSLQDALAHLGLNTVRSIALSFSFADAMRGDTPGVDRDLNQLWCTSLMTGLAARRLASETGDWDPQQAFVAGLLADTGALVMYEALPEHRGLVGRFLAGEKDLIELERQELECDHAAIGSLLLDNWSFPRDLCSLIAAHHQHAGTEPSDDPHVRILDAAWECARGLVVDGFRREVSDLTPRIVASSGILPHVIESILEELPDELREIAGAFEIAVEEQRSYAELRSGAADALRSIAIEADRSAYLYAAATGGGRSGFEDIRQALKPTLGGEAETGLMPRHSMERLLEAFYVRAEQRRRPLGLLVVEVDGAKDVDGDSLIDSVVARLGERLRSQVREEDELARFDRERIALIMPDCEGSDLLVAAQRLRRGLESGGIEIPGFEGMPGLTMGAAFVIPHTDRSEFSALIHAAEEALERARTSEQRLSL